eukprot:scaffold49732_cov62-Phaeocystis_antarctica.AAC.3
MPGLVSIEPSGFHVAVADHARASGRQGKPVDLGVGSRRAACWVEGLESRRASQPHRSLSHWAPGGGGSSRVRSAGESGPQEARGEPSKSPLFNGAGRLNAAALDLVEQAWLGLGRGLG